MISPGLILMLVASAPLARQAAAGGTQVLLVTGLSGEPRFAAAFHAAAAAIYDAAKSRWVRSDSSVIYLAEDPAQDPARIRARATRDCVASAIASMGARSAPGDVVLIVLIGHGSGQGTDSRLNLPGPDATAADFATWLAPLSGRIVVLVNASSGSGDFVAALSAKDRVVVTATKSAMERNETTFGEYFAKALVSELADADRDGRVTLLEAFDFTRREVARGYEAKNLLATEHALLDDDGDGKGSAAPGAAPGDGALARTVAFGTAPLPTDPRVATLVAERRALEGQVDALRRRKATMDSTAYQRELERLLLEIATRSAAIRAATGQKP
ncbi:MAG: hypothetical protein ABI838_10570 [Chloroflexota bacterium]